MPRFLPRTAFITKHLIKSVFLILLALVSSIGNSQELTDYDELNVDIKVPRLGIYEIPIAIRDQDAYIAVVPFFDLLQLKIEEKEKGRFSGYVIDPANSFEINIANSTIRVKDEDFLLQQNDYILSPTTFYLNTKLFDQVFGLSTPFNFRSLSIDLVTDKELPLIKQKRLESLRKNINRVQGIIEPDTILNRNYPFFKAGMLDWGVITTQQTNGLNDNRINVGLGTMLAGGETNLRLNYSTNLPLTSRNQFYQWKLVNNRSVLFKQVTAGKIFTRSTSSLFAPVVGIQLSNSPVLNRRSFGTYNLSDFTDPGWTVELYVNNVLLDYTKADASGFFSFDVPLMYGNTTVDLRFYGPYGEERSEERFINIPYTFIPKKELEYTFSAGIVEDEDNRRFSRLNLNYGLSNDVTIGGGVEYLNDVSSGEIMPFINTSARLSSNLLFTGSYTYQVRAEALLSYRTSSNVQLDLNYISYNKDQTAINYNYLEERKLTLSAPIRSKTFSAFSRFSLNQIIMPTTEFTTAQLLLSGIVYGVSTNLTTFGLFNERAKDPTIYTMLSQTYRLPLQVLFSPQIQYEFSSGDFTNLVLEFERPAFKRGFFNLAYENNFGRNAHTLEIGLRYNFDFAQTSLTSRIGNRNSSFVQSAQGSFLYDRPTSFVDATRRTSVGKAGITIIPFLDYNSNGKKDETEPGVPGLQFRSKPGKVSYNRDKTVIRISDLQPYRNLLLKVDPSSIDNIAWRVENPTISIETMPNQFRRLEIPVKVLGEVSGMVYFEDAQGRRGLGRIRVQIMNEQEDVVAQFLTEGDGYFTYLGLEPGKYTAMIDQEQLEVLDFKSSEVQSFNIEVSEFGDIVDDIELILRKRGVQ